MNLINISTSAGIAGWQPAAWLRVSGPDAAAFLQGQFTNDLRELRPGQTVYGLWLNVKGKVLADSFVLSGKTVDEFWLGSYFSPSAAIRERLESHIIADDVTIEDQTNGWFGLTVFAGDGGSETPASTASVGFRFAARRGRPATEWMVPIDGIEKTRALFPTRQDIGSEEMERWRIAAGIPAIPRDLGPADLPNEAGLDTDAISYTKGCYLGQEVMARLKSLGQVRRRLLRVRSALSTIPSMPTPLFVGARQVGELRSAVNDGMGGFIGLAMLSLLHVSAGQKLALAPDAVAEIALTDTP